MSRDQHQEIQNIVNNLIFNGRHLSKAGIIEGIGVTDEKIAIIISFQEITEDINDIEEFIKTKLAHFPKDIEFIRTTKREKSNNILKKKFDSIKKVILVSSGKGGVGKSTLTYYLACALANKGRKVGVLDADIYGPSIPVLAKIHEEPKILNNLFQPILKNGIKFISIGLMIPPEKSLVWRGPMITKALHKLFNSTSWGELDYLLVDMPPGTGDIHLSICEKYHVDGVIMVTTPSTLSYADVSRAEDMYKKLGLQILGKICNMAYLEMDKKKKYIFGESSSKNEYQLPLLENISSHQQLIKLLDNFIDKNIIL